MVDMTTSLKGSTVHVYNSHHIVPCILQAIAKDLWHLQMIEPWTPLPLFQYDMALAEFYTHWESDDPQLMYPQQWQSNLQIRTREVNESKWL